MYLLHLLQPAAEGAANNDHRRFVLSLLHPIGEELGMVHVLRQIDAGPEGLAVHDVDDEVGVGDLLRDFPGGSVEEVELVVLRLHLL